MIPTDFYPATPGSPSSLTPFVQLIIFSLDPVFFILTSIIPCHPLVTPCNFLSIHFPVSLTMNSVMSWLLSTIRWILDQITFVYTYLFWPDKKGRIPAFTNRLILKPATELADLIKKGEIRSEDVVRAYIKRIKEVNEEINAVVDERFEQAIADAKMIDEKVDASIGSWDMGTSSPLPTSSSSSPFSSLELEQMPLLGIPFSCKDSFAIKGMICSAGLPQKKDFRPDYDADVIKNLRKAGAIPIVVGNVPELLIWWTAENKTFGRTNNPYDLNCISGGSSGGDCSLLASGGALFAVGSDIGGSIRIPCCMNGVFGHKTTTGIIPHEGKIPPLHLPREPFFSMGPMTRFASDIKPVLKAMAGDRISLLPNIDSKVDFSKVQIYFMLDDNDPIKSRVNQQIRESILKAVAHFNTRFNSQAQQVVFEDFRFAAKMFLSSMAQAGGEPVIKSINEGLPGQLNVYWEFLKAMFGFSSHTRHITTFALVQHHVPPPDSKWVKDNVAMAGRLRNEITTLLGPNGILIMPAYPDAVPKHGTTLLNNQNIMYFTILNVLGLPATQIPIGLDREKGTPLGIQVTSNKYNDHLCIEAAIILEKLFGGWVPPAPFIHSAT